ncbi:hypothetical protein [Nocardia sp. NPDC046763]|uniref:hypothetical protein n=1 Tax=Nocardia sp. NPDC046763 TaxID=3155256 RepID=UPI0033DA1A67
MTTPNLPAIAEQGAESIRRLARIRDILRPKDQFDMLFGILVALRDNLYSGMHILQRVDGSLVITVTPPDAERE